MNALKLKTTLAIKIQKMYYTNDRIYTSCANKLQKEYISD